MLKKSKQECDYSTLFVDIIEDLEWYSLNLQKLYIVLHSIHELMDECDTKEGLDELEFLAEKTTIVFSFATGINTPIQNGAAIIEKQAKAGLEFLYNPEKVARCHRQINLDSEDLFVALAELYKTAIEKASAIKPPRHIFNE